MGGRIGRHLEDRKIIRKEERYLVYYEVAFINFLDPVDRQIYPP